MLRESDIGPLLSMGPALWHAQAEGGRWRAEGGREVVDLQTKAPQSENESRVSMADSERRSRGPAVVLLSGGLDSATTAAIARTEGFRLFALSIDYGQRHRFELDAARRVAESLGVERHIVTSVDLSKFGGSALTNHIDVPLDRNLDQISHGIPITYVPARNTVFLAIALGYA